MVKFLTKNNKIIYMTYGILLFIVILGGLFYMSQYADIQVFYTLDEAGNLREFTRDTPNQLGFTNINLFDYFTKYSGQIITDESGAVLVNGADWIAKNGATQAAFLQAFPNPENFATTYAHTVYDFQIAMSQFNDLIITFGMFGIVCFALLLVFANHSRRIYYKSNLYSGIILPAAVIIFAIVMIVKNSQLMNVFNDNYELFNLTAVLQDPKINAIVSQKDYAYVQSQYSCNSATFIAFTALFVVVILYSLFLMVYAVLKYKRTSEERQEIMKRAVVNND